jgi:hypothetical protein
MIPNDPAVHWVKKSFKPSRWGHLSLLLVVNVEGNVAFKKAIFWRVALNGLPILLQLAFSLTRLKQATRRTPAGDVRLQERPTDWNVLSEAVSAPNVLDLQGHDYQDGRHHDGSGQYR